MTAYYNEIDPVAAHVLECLIKDRIIADGIVDRRSIADVAPGDLDGFAQAHFFAGGGLWSVAARMAGWPDDKPMWTGSCPCQPFSVAGKGAGTDDPRHLWPHFFRLIRSRRPALVLGEQVAGRAGYGWFDGVRADLEGEGYASRAVDIPACAIDAPHIRQRLYWVALANTDSPERRAAAEGRRHDDDRQDAGREEAPGRHQFHRAGDMADADDARWQGRDILPERPDEFSPWSRGVEWRRGADGKERRVKSGVRLLVDGLPGRVGMLRIAGNAIVPPLAAEIIRACMESGL